MSSKAFLSGFCNPSNPPSSHVRCRVVCEGRPCVCRCHQAEAALRVVLEDMAAKAEEVHVLLAGELGPWVEAETRQCAGWAVRETRRALAALKGNRLGGEDT